MADSPTPAVRPDAPPAANYFVTSLWTLCAHCGIAFTGNHYCGASFQTPDARPFPDGLPADWIAKIQARYPAFGAARVSDDGAGTDTASANYFVTGRWTLCAHCEIAFVGEHYCGAPFQTPDTRPFPDGIPAEWVTRIQDDISIRDSVALEVLCRVFDRGADEVFEEWQSWYTPTAWLHWSRGLGAFVYTLLERGEALAGKLRAAPSVSAGAPEGEPKREAVYIAGPMRGLPEHNFPAFRSAKDRFIALGFDVESPVDIGERLFGNNPTVPGGSYLRADVQILSQCDAIALLPGWTKSVGARCEVVVALTLGMAFYDAETGLPMPAPASVTCNGGYERPPGSVDTLDSLADEIRPWADATFPAKTPSSVAEHLRREAVELCRQPSDVEEMADIFFLLVQAAEPFDFPAAIRAKLEKNRRRAWGKPDADGVVEHVEVPS